MKLVIDELKKLNIRKFILPVFIILACINMFLYNQKSVRAGVTMRDIEVTALFELYISDRAAFDAGYAIRQEEMELAMKIFNEARAEGNYDFPESADIPGVPQIYKYEFVVERAKYSSFYKNYISNVINEAYRNLRDFENTGVGTGDYAYKLQQRIIEKYTDIKDTAVLGFENVRGWDLLFDGDGDIFIFFLVALIVSSIFTIDSTTGFQSILHITKKGRLHTGIAKIIATFLTVIITISIFYISSAIIIGINTGFSNINNGIQNIQTYIGCEYNINMGQASIIIFLIKTAVLFIFALFTAVLALLFRSRPFSFAFSSILTAINYAVYYFTQTANVGHNLNVSSAARVSDLLERYRTLNLFSEPISFITIILFFIILFLVALPPIILLPTTAGLNSARRSR